ncbi:MAG: enoyl-CoA hydratase/isomerase family protein [Burkholderiales bacterium]|nr:enoyl-CoA hydratase/isomerase family protein [Burkholderiales bacterium]
MGEFDDIAVSRPADGVTLIVIARPEARNALRTRTLAEIAAVLTAAADDAAARAVVITGGVKHFAAGADLKEMAPLDAIGVLTHERPRHWRAIQSFPKPLVAAVCGYALGAGCELALACDLVVAGSNAQFGQPEINLGMIPGAGGAARLARTCGKALAMQMVLTGAPIDARAALAAGIAVEVDEPESAIARAIEIASLIASKPPLAVRAAKEAVLRALEAPLSEAVAADRQAFALLAASEDRREGIAAFLEKRTPRFTGR